MKRFWGKREGFFGGSGFRAKTGNSSRHEKESFFVFPTNATKATNATAVFERRKGAFIYIIIE